MIDRRLHGNVTIKHSIIQKWNIDLITMEILAFSVNKHPSASDVSKFGRVLFGGFGVLGARFYVTWMTGAMYLEIVMTTIMLTVLFCVLLPIFSVIGFGDPLRLKFERDGTYWENPSTHESTLERIMRQF